MTLKPLQEAHSVAKAYEHKLNEVARKNRRMDPRFNNAVQVIHSEGTNEVELKWGPDPYGDLKRKAEEDAALDAEESSADADDP